MMVRWKRFADAGITQTPRTTLGPENFSGSPAAVIFYTVEFVRGR